MAALQALRYSRGSLELLDQRLLPLQSAYVRIATLQEAHDAILSMLVRGAPAIAIAAGLALAVELVGGSGASRWADGQAAAAHVSTSLDFLITSRPTAVNLAELAGRLKAVAAGAASGGSAAVVEAVVSAAEDELRSDVATNRAIGLNGAQALLSGVAAGAGVRVLTHCNTGSLATAGYGTALGCVRALKESGRLAAVFCTETRPYNQGARLTAFELVTDGLQPATLVVDSATAALMASGQIDAVVVGADRVAANGDTANKIGTYSLAVAAAAHGVPFYVAAPCTTLDPHTASGADILIEQRDPKEVTHARGGAGERVAAEGISVWNPGFDVTPAKLIAGIITEKGVLRHATPGSAALDVRSHLGLPPHPPAASTAAMSPAAALDFAAARPALAARLGGCRADWSAREIGDGNINFVFVLTGPAGALVLKQALPYIRMVGEGWPLSPDRLRIEAQALMEQRRACEAHVPEVYDWDEKANVLSMRYIQPPHTVLRGALVRGDIFPQLATHIGDFMGSTLFHTSVFALSFDAFRELRTRFDNPAMCALTLQVVFTDPYYAADVNRHTSPQLDADVESLRADEGAVRAATALKRRFMGEAQALLHGDLHTGSCMVTGDSTFVFDSEFAFMGPIGFDLGAWLANLLLAYFAAASHGGARAEQRAWLLTCLVQLYAQFELRFRREWDEAAAAGSSGAAAEWILFQSRPEALRAVQDDFLATVLRDAIGYAGAKMVRRLVGVAHVEDFECIADADARAACERVALRFGRRLLVEAETFSRIQEVAEAAAAAR